MYKMKLNIVFINPPNVPFSSKGILIEPIDTLALASTIQSLGYSTSFLDMDVKKLLAEDLNTTFKNDWPAIIVIVFDYHIPLHDFGANQEIANICQLSKANNCTIILGGKAATFYSEDKIRELGADIFIKHDMELPLSAILNKFIEFPKDWKHHLQEIPNIRYFDKNKLFLTENKRIKPNLNSFPIPNRNLIDLNDYIDVRTILSSRGCNLKCTFCHVPGFWGVWQSRTVDSVVEEITLLYEKFDSKKVLFLDDNAMAQPKRLSDISKKLQTNNIKVALGCLGTISSYKREALDDMYSGGFRWIHYGAESGDDIQLTTMGKRITSKKIAEVVAGTKASGLRVRTSWILDMPDLSLDGLLKTEELILNHQADEIRLHFLTIRLGSILYEHYLLDTPQFIHNSKPNLNISGVSDKMIHDSLERILNGLISQGYTVIKNPDDFIDIECLKKINPKLKIVSLCPLRYGLNWQY